MNKYLIKRVLIMIPLLLVVSMITYLLSNLAPGDPAATQFPPGRTEPTEEQIEATRKALGLDKPIYIRYLIWLKNLVTGNMGYSMFTGRPVMTEIAERLPITMLICGLSMAIGIVLGISIGIFTALHQNKFVDYFFSVLAFIGISVPGFWIAMMCVLLFSEKLRWLPSFGLQDPDLLGQKGFHVVIDKIKHLIMPVFTLALTDIASWTRYQRSSFLEVINQDYIRTARAKGVSQRAINWRHAFRNSALPIVTMLGMTIPGLVGGAFLIETVFAIPGMGRVGMTAILNRDYPLIMGTGFFSAVLVMIGMLVSDILYAVVDPRIRLS